MIRWLKVVLVTFVGLQGLLYFVSNAFNGSSAKLAAGTVLGQQDSPFYSKIRRIEHLIASAGHEPPAEVPEVASEPIRYRSSIRQARALWSRFLPLVRMPSVASRPHQA